MTTSWVTQTIETQAQIGLPKNELIFSERSAYQTVEVMSTPSHGKLFLIDGQFMFSERDEHIYHEMMVQVPVFLHGNPKQVLIIGGGDGGAAREVLKHTGVERCVVIEIDEAIVRASKGYFPQTAIAYQSPRLKLLTEDAVAWAEKAALEGKEKFDLILVTPTDPVTSALAMIGDEFYSHLKKLLNYEGMLVAQAESPFYAEKVQRALAAILKNHFNRVHFYNYTDLTTAGGLGSFAFASDSVHPIDDLNSARVISAGIETHWYNLGVHEAAFLLPEFQKRELREFLNPL